MLKRLQTYIANEGLFENSDSLLLAVSGGLDSMVMLQLFQQLPYRFSVLHCNFHLRGAESDGDESFLKDYCAAHQLDLQVKHFHTKAYAKQEGVSIEMAARDLRYAWFREQKTRTQSHYILTAHHRDDLIETMLINLSRGTGIKGLVGIQPKKNELVRPLLFASRQELSAYAQSIELAHCNDSSNDELLYQRNIVRHQIIPLFEQLNSNFRNNVARTAQHLQHTSQIYYQAIESQQAQLLQNNQLNIATLQNYPNAPTLLFETLSPYGFNAAQCADIYQSLQNHSGKTFHSKTHRLIKDRSHLLLDKIPQTEAQQAVLLNKNQHISKPLSLSVQLEPRPKNHQFSTTAKQVELDADKLKFPLTLRKWQEGDSFTPLGMSGSKKLSDFFIDQKMSILDKEAQWLLCSTSGEIAWIVGRRINDHFKITPNTQTLCRLKID